MLEECVLVVSFIVLLAFSNEQKYSLLYKSQNFLVVNCINGIVERSPLSAQSTISEFCLLDEKIQLMQEHKYN